ncbi:transcriptional regulator [Pseudomonas sp. 1D4]|nr:transcriptional regulator [Pseudomonas sp. 1D4]
MNMAARLKAMRAREGITQAQLSADVGLPLSTLKKYEASLRLEISLVSLQKITSHRRYRKYALWLLTGETTYSGEQVSPL